MATPDRCERALNPLWYATRATGGVAFLPLTILSVLAVLSAARVGGRRVPRFALTEPHRNLSLVTLVFPGLRPGPGDGGR